MRGRGGKIKDGREKGERELGRERGMPGSRATRGAGTETHQPRGQKQVDKRYQESLVTRQGFKHADKEGSTRCRCI